MFQYEADKAADGVVAKLAPFRDTLTADAEHRFHAVFATGRVVEAGCNAHGRRKFHDAEATRPGLAAEGGAFIAAMYQRHGAALFRFFDDPDVPIDNSPTEREFQSVAKLRLNMLFAGSTEGAHRACVLLGTVATCRAVGIPVQAYLTWAFERLGTHRDVFALPVEQLTPVAFKRARG